MDRYDHKRDYQLEWVDLLRRLLAVAPYRELSCRSRGDR